MPEIKCPHCGTTFTVDESEYHRLLTSVRDEAFHEELESRSKAIAEKEENQRLLLQKDYQAKEKDLEVKLREAEAKALSDKRVLEDALNRAKDEAEKDTELAIAKEKAKSNEDLQAAKEEIESLKAQIQLKAKETEFLKKEAENEKEKAIVSLQNDLELERKERQLSENKLKESYEERLRLAQEETQHYKDLKSRLTTKMVGESLEQHCLNEFNKIRGAFPKVYFEKDNDASDGSKGDFIYRETEPDGTEILSIMFEMKNEIEETAVKHKNEDFFAKLDKDRKTKKCEYAVLVSLLEQDNDFYNAGIADVSYRYDKMYVIRPQCFIPMITLLRNAALKSQSYRNELALQRAANIDVTNFESKLLDFQDKFGKNYESAKTNFDKAIEEIDKTIAHLQKVKDSLTTSSNQLRLANDKAQGLSIKKLTHGNPTMKKAFEEAEKQTPIDVEGE